MENNKFNFKDFHEQQILEWMKNGYGEQTVEEALVHSYNLYVYVRDSEIAVGLLFYLHTLGYQVDDMWIQPWHLSEFMSLGNRFITLIGNRVGFGSMTYKTVEGDYLTDKEIKEAIDLHISRCKKNAEETPEEEKTQTDYELAGRPIINCGTNHKMFKLLAKWNNDDIHTKLIVNSYDAERPHLQWPFDNLETIEEYNGGTFKDGRTIDWHREATIDDIIEYFSGKGNWNHKPTCESIKFRKGGRRYLKFEDTI